MTIQHKNIPNAQLHEPKGVSTASDKMVYFADGAGSGEWRVISESEIDYAVKANNLFGWNDISDSLYTSGSPRAITASTRTQLTNNGNAAQTDITRLGALWNTSTNLFLINDLNSFYTLRIAMKATAAAAATVPYIMLVELQSDSGSLVFSGSTLAMKGGGNVNQLTFIVPFYLGSAINNTNIKVFVTPDTDTSIYDIGFVLKRDYKEA